jgi:hypothetical protein
MVFLLFSQPVTGAFLMLSLYPASCYNPAMRLFSLFQHLRNAVKTRKTAKAIFPLEKWIQTESHIWVAESRMVERSREKDKWEREMSQARILTRRGSIAYFLPERKMRGGAAALCADLVLDGVVTEMKTVSGSRATLGTEFRFAYKQGAVLLADNPGIKAHSVFIRLKSELSAGSVKAKIAGELKKRHTAGSCICFFEASRELYIWTFEELRAIIGSDKKSPGPL